MKITGNTTKEFNYEVYTVNPKTGEQGWDIKFVSVIADTKEDAIKALKSWKLFDCVILFNFAVDCPYDGNLATLSDKVKAAKGWIIEMSGYRTADYKSVLHTN